MSHDIIVSSEKSLKRNRLNERFILKMKSNIKSLQYRIFSI